MALKHKFKTQAEALLHGDMHTGSIMASQDETFVFDAEFAFYGPIGFDVGKLIGNLLLAYFASYGHDRSAGTSAPTRDAQRAWLLDSIVSLWNGFKTKFEALWTEHHEVGPDAYLYQEQRKHAHEHELLKAVQGKYLQALFDDTLSFAGACMIRRLVGIAHVADMESIKDPDQRANCERAALKLGLTLLVPGRRDKISSIADVVAAAALMEVPHV